MLSPAASSNNTLFHLSRSLSQFLCVFRNFFDKSQTSLETDWAAGALDAQERQL